jgi:hypothetical protein
MHKTPVSALFECLFFVLSHWQRMKITSPYFLIPLNLTGERLMTRIFLIGRAFACFHELSGAEGGPFFRLAGCWT